MTVQEIRKEVGIYGILETSAKAKAKAVRKMHTLSHKFGIPLEVCLDAEFTIDFFMQQSNRDILTDFAGYFTADFHNGESVTIYNEPKLKSLPGNLGDLVSFSATDSQGKQCIIQLFPVTTFMMSVELEDLIEKMRKEHTAEFPEKTTRPDLHTVIITNFVFMPLDFTDQIIGWDLYMASVYTDGSEDADPEHDPVSSAYLIQLPVATQYKELFLKKDPWQQYIVSILYALYQVSKGNLELKIDVTMEGGEEMQRMLQAYRMRLQ